MNKLFNNLWNKTSRKKTSVICGSTFYIWNVYDMICHRVSQFGVVFFPCVNTSWFLFIKEEYLIFLAYTCHSIIPLIFSIGLRSVEKALHKTCKVITEIRSNCLSKKDNWYHFFSFLLISLEALESVSILAHLGAWVVSMFC